MTIEGVLLIAAAVALWGVMLAWLSAGLTVTRKDTRDEDD